VLDVRVTEREGAVAEATRLRNQVHQLLLQRDPAYHTHLPSLRTTTGVAAAAGYTATAPGPLAQHRAGAVLRLAER